MMRLLSRQHKEDAELSSPTMQPKGTGELTKERVRSFPVGGEQAAEWPLTVQMTARRCQSLHFSSPGILKYAAYLDEKVLSMSMGKGMTGM